MISLNRKLPMSHQVTMKHRNGRFLINSEEYVDPVEVPSNKTMLLSSEEFSIQKAQIHKGTLKSAKGSNFYAYAKMINSIEEVHEAYATVKADHLSATHIMCGCRIFGSKFFYLQNYSDDGEHNGGRQILNALKDLKVWNIAVFVVRYHDGPNLGKLRFKITQELTTDVVTSYPRGLNYGHSFTDKTLLKVRN